MAFIEFTSEDMAVEAVREMAGAYIGELPVGVVMSPEHFDRTSRKLKIISTKNTLALGSELLREHFTAGYLGAQYGLCVYAFQATVEGMPPFGFALFNDEEAARIAEDSLAHKGFSVRREIC